MWRAVPLTATQHHVTAFRSRTTYPVAGDRRHDPLVFIGVTVAIVNVRDSAGAVIGDPIHCIAPKAERGDLGQAGSPQIMRRRPLQTELGDQLLHQRA